MRLPNTYELALRIAESLGVREGDGFEKTTHRRQLQRAAQDPDSEAPAADNLLDALGRLTSAVGHAVSPTDTKSVGRRTALMALHEASVLYGRLRFHLDLHACSASRSRRLILWRFAVPFLGVTIGEHAEGYTAGVDLARIPSAPFRLPREGRPTALVFHGLLARSGARTFNHLAEIINWPYEVQRLYEWSDPHSEAGPISRSKIEEVYRLVDESGVLDAAAGFGRSGPFHLNRGADTAEQASAAAEYLLSRKRRCGRGECWHLVD